MTEPVKVRVPAPCNAFPVMHFTLHRSEDATKRIRVLLRDIAEIIEADDAKLHLLLKAAHWAEAVDHLLDGLLELIRREQEHEIEAWWFLSYPGTGWPAWPQDAGSSEAVAA